MTTAAFDTGVSDSLCDALARGRLCLAELTLLEPPELEAMYGIGMARLQTGRIDEAVTILQALVALYGYSAKYWRGLGLALHTGRHAEAAMVAYNLALHLDPDHVPTVGFLGELKLFCGMPEEALPLLERAAHSGHPRAAPRAAQLLGAPAALPLPDVPSEPARRPNDSVDLVDTFELTGGGPLPVPHPQEVTAPLSFPAADEVTDKIFLADSLDVTDAIVRPITQTAIVHCAKSPRSLGHEGSATDTGVVDRGLDAPAENATWDFVRWFTSAARRRRRAEPLLDNDETSPMHPGRRPR